MYAHVHGSCAFISPQLKCFHKKSHTGVDTVFCIQFHTAVVRDDFRLVYGKSDLDAAFKDKRYPDTAKVELIFEPWDDQNQSGVLCALPENSICHPHVCVCVCV